MSIDTSLIDLDNLASENDKETNEVEIDDSSTNSEKRGRTQNNLAQKYKYYTQEYDEEFRLKI